MSLVATRPVLYRSIQYRAGDVLPADNVLMVEAWLDAGSAVTVEDEETVEAPEAPETPKAPKAIPVAPPEGKAGISSDGDPDARVGRIPKTGRKKK